MVSARPECITAAAVWLTAITLMLASSSARAETLHAGTKAAPIRLADIVKASAGSPAGDLDLGPAPAPGTTRTIRRQEILDRLAAAGLSRRGLRIPRKTVIGGDKAPDPTTLHAQARAQLSRHSGHCRLLGLDWRRSGYLDPKARIDSAQIHGPLRSGRQSATLWVQHGQQSRRVGLFVNLDCPRALIARQSPVRIVARVGRVRATTAGIAREAGRLGDIIRVYNPTAKKTVQAKVLSSSEVEVLP